MISGTTDVLDVLFTMHSKYPYLHPSTTDANGNTLLHIVAKAQSSKRVQQAARFLCTKDVNPNIKNKDGMTVLSCLKKNDKILEFIRQAATKYDQPIKAKKKKKSRSNANPSNENKPLLDNENTSNESDTQKERLENQTPMKKSEVFQKDATRKRIEELLDKIEDWSEEDVLKKGIVNDKNTTTQTVSPEMNDEVQNLAPDVPDDPATDGHDEGIFDGEQEDADQDDSGFANDREELFEELEWEVDCTSEVWKILRDHKLLPATKRKIISKIKFLASGEWRPELCKILKGNTANMKLFEAKLDKAARIIWELTVAFSPRRSETINSDIAHKKGSGLSNSGRIYTDIIRIWDIVFDHDNLDRCVNNIRKSISRGENCTIQKTLTGQSSEVWDLDTPGKRIPRVYMEIGDDHRVMQKPEKKFSPPASSSDTEYHIMKFYSVNSALISTILQQSQVKVDFPFKVTDLEHDIINLKPNPPAPILLLGRSGTGEATVRHR